MEKWKGNRWLSLEGKVLSMVRGNGKEKGNSCLYIGEEKRNEGLPYDT